MNISIILSDDWIGASNEFNEYARQITKYGFYKGVNTEQQEQQGIDFERSVSLKDSGKVSKRGWYSTLLCTEKGGNLLQDKTMRVSGKRVEGLGPKLWAIEDKLSGEGAIRNSKEIRYRKITIEDWNSFCKTNESKVRLS